MQRLLYWLDIDGLAETLTDSQNLGMLGFLCFAFLAYEFLSMERSCRLEESVCHYKRQAWFRWFQVLDLLLLAVQLTSVIFGYCVFACATQGADLSLLVPYLLKCSLLNLFFVMTIGLLLGVLLARLCTRYAAYGIIFLITALVAFLGEFLAAAVSAVSSSQLDAYPLFDLFSICAPDLNWVTDAVYGVPMEGYRWDKAIFWLSVLSISCVCLLSAKQGKRTGRRIICVVCSAMALCSLWNYGQSGNDSYLLKDDSYAARTSRTFDADWYYYHYSEDAVIREEEAAFQVESYALDFSIRRRLKATATLTLSGSPENGTYSFTLYHGYVVTGVTDQAGNDLPYTRAGDYLEVTCAPVDGMVISYEGTGGKYYSNSQGIALPGYFAYYPMAGCLALWESSSGSMKVNTDFETKEFTVTVDSGLHILSNLDETGEHTFSGTAQTVTLIGGLVEERELDGVSYLCQVMGESPYYGAPNSFRTPVSLLEEYRQEPVNSYQVFCLPVTLLQANANEEAAVIYFDDHILTDTYNETVLMQGMQEWIDSHPDQTEEAEHD
ncbi:MAG: hypothetical protein LUD83_04215 [Clostridiales bacterium]|nr:hypothetical protein [Clostridiales bacterium]